MEDEQVYNAYQSRGIRGYGPTGLWGDQYETPKTTRAGRVFLIIIIVLATIAALIIGIILWRRRIVPTTSTGGTPPNCTTLGCTGGQVCNTTTLTCVDCLSNTNCPESSPICDIATYKCKECVITADCTGASVCNAGICCDPSAPTINTVTPITSGTSQVTITYTSIQTGSKYSNLMVEVSIETPAGVFLAAKTMPALGGTVTVSETDLALPNQHLYPNTGYRTRIRMKYTCVDVDNNITDYSAPVEFTMPVCFLTLYNDSTFTGNGVDSSFFGFYPGVIIFFPAYLVPFNIGVVADTNPEVHPNQAAIYHPLITTVSAPQPPADNTYQCAKIPYPGPVGSTFTFRYFNLSPSGNCISLLSNSRSFTRNA